MKVALASDLHIEFGDVKLNNDEDADVLILAGDIMVVQSRNSDLWVRRFLDDVYQQFSHVIYIAGNHEHYHGDFQKTDGIIREYLKPYEYFHYLSNDAVQIDDTVFYGGTLWTDMNRREEATILHAGEAMSDFALIRNGQYDRFTPRDAIEQHELCLAHLDGLLDTQPGAKIVVVTHHAPSRQSTHPRYKSSRINGAYSSDLEKILIDHPNIALWCHGHTHDPYDYMVGNTRVACNPRGYYGFETNDVEFKLKYMEI